MAPVATHTRSARSADLKSTLIERDLPGNARTILELDHGKGGQQPGVHNRWHPEIPAIDTIRPGEVVRVWTLDWSGGQVGNDDCADDVLAINHDSDHQLSGPFDVEGAQPGDVLAVDIIHLEPSEVTPWGYSIVGPGIGSLDRPGTRYAKAIWDFKDGETSSRHIPGVHFGGRMFPGIVGVAPSQDVLTQWTAREAELQSAYSCHGFEASPLPTNSAAFVGAVGQKIPGLVRQRIYNEGARTGPARENGGNMDFASLVAGSRLYLPVFVDGAKLSLGDVHFCEGDGEPTTAIEMSAIVTIRCSVIKNGMANLGIRQPVYETSASEPRFPRQLVFTGNSVNEAIGGRQHMQNGILSYRNAAWDAMDYLKKFGYTEEQAYMLMACAPVESRVLTTANKPNMGISIGLPLDIFDFDIGFPASGAPTQRVFSGPAELSEEKAAKVYTEQAEEVL